MGITQLLKRATKDERPFLVGLAQVGEVLLAEEPGEDADREKELRPGRDPAISVRGEPASWDDAVHMGMMHERLPPGMQDGGKANPGAQVLGVPRDSCQGLRGCSEEQPVEGSLVLKGDRAEFLRQREDDVEVRDFEQMRALRLMPGRLFGGLALGTVAIAARVVGYLMVTAGITAEPVPPEDGSTASREITQYPPLSGRCPMEGTEFVLTGAEDLGHFVPRRPHQATAAGLCSAGSGGAKRSSLDRAPPSA